MFHRPCSLPGLVCGVPGQPVPDRASPGGLFPCCLEGGGAVGASSWPQLTPMQDIAQPEPKCIAKWGQATQPPQPSELRGQDTGDKKDSRVKGLGSLPPLSSCQPSWPGGAQCAEAKGNDGYHQVGPGQRLHCGGPTGTGPECPPGAGRGRDDGKGGQKN